MINRDQISNLRKLFIENQGEYLKKNSENKPSSEALNESVPGQIRDLHKKMQAEKTVNNPVPMSVSARSIAVTSGKGGVGKTNFVANLAIAMSRLGKKVLILDADLGLANVDVIYGIRPKYNLYHVITGQKKVSEIIVRGPENVLLIPGGSGIAELANINENERRHFISEMDELEHQVDIILVDTSAGINKNVLCFLKACSEIIFITIPEPPAMTDAYAIIKSVAADEKLTDQTMSLVVNRALNPTEAQDVYGRLATVSRRFLNVKLENLGYVLDDRAVSLAVRAQKPFIYSSPSSSASKCVESIAQKLLNIKNEKMTSQTALNKIGAGVSSFFSKIGELFN